MTSAGRDGTAAGTRKEDIDRQTSENALTRSGRKQDPAVTFGISPRRKIRVTDINDETGSLGMTCGSRSRVLANDHRQWSSDILRDMRMLQTDSIVRGRFLDVLM